MLIVSGGGSFTVLSSDPNRTSPALVMRPGLDAPSISRGWPAGTDPLSMDELYRVTGYRHADTDTSVRSTPQLQLPGPHGPCCTGEFIVQLERPCHRRCSTDISGCSDVRFILECVSVTD